MILNWVQDENLNGFVFVGVFEGKYIAINVLPDFAKTPNGSGVPTLSRGEGEPFAESLKIPG